jgi:hypothetical protein
VDRLAIARALVDSGVPELEVGVPAMGPDAVADIAAVAAVVGRERVVTWCRGAEADLLAATKTGVAAVHLSFPASPLHQAVWRMTPEEVLTRMGALVTKARERFERIYVGAQDASRVEPEFLAGSRGWLGKREQNAFVMRTQSADSRRARLRRRWHRSSGLRQKSKSNFTDTTTSVSLQPTHSRRMKPAPTP